MYHLNHHVHTVFLACASGVAKPELDILVPWSSVFRQQFLKCAGTIKCSSVCCWLANEPVAHSTRGGSRWRNIPL